MCLCVCDTNPLDCWPLASGAIVALAATFPPGLGQDLVMVNSILDALFYFLFFYFCAAAMSVFRVFVVMHIGVASARVQGWAFLCCCLTTFAAVLFPTCKVF